MRDMRKIRKPKKKAKELGDEIVELASWGMLPHLEVGAYLSGLTFKILLTLTMIIPIVFLLYQIPNEKLITLVSLVLGLASVAISAWGILKGIETLYMKERYERKVVIYPSSYEFDNERIVATVINIGDPLIVRRVDLVVGWVEVNRPISYIIGRGLFTFTVLGYVPLYAGCFPMNKGSIWRIPEDIVRKGLEMIVSWPPNKDTRHIKEMDPKAYLIMTDRFVEYSKEEYRGKTSGLISMCSLGDFNSLLDRVQRGEKIFTLEVALHFQDSLESGKLVPGRMIRYMPPFMPSEEEQRIEHMQILEKMAEKLDFIEKSLSRMNRKFKSKKGVKKG